MDIVHKETDQGVKVGLSRRTILFGIVGILLALLVAILLMIMAKDEPPAAVTAAYDKARVAQEKGDYEAELGALQSVIHTVKSKEEKIELYNDLAAAATSAGEVEEAIRYYNSKHELDPGTSARDGYLLGVLYERTDNATAALAQYEAYLAYLQAQPSDENREAQIASMQARIAALKEEQ